MPDSSDVSARSKPRRQGCSPARCAGSSGWATATRRSSNRARSCPRSSWPSPAAVAGSGPGPATRSRHSSTSMARPCKQFRLELARRWPEIRHIGVSFEDDRGRQRGGMIQALDDEHGPDHRGIPVTVRLEAAELETADGLITAGVAASRAEALRWALSRVREAGLQLPAVPRGQDDLGHQVGAQAELLRDLVRPPSLLVVEQRQFLLRLGPRPRDVARPGRLRAVLAGAGGWAGRLAGTAVRAGRVRRRPGRTAWRCRTSRAAGRGTCRGPARPGSPRQGAGTARPTCSPRRPPWSGP